MSKNQISKRNVTEIYFFKFGSVNFFKLSSKGAQST